MSILNVPTFCVITGASRGIGRETAIQLAGSVGARSSFYLVARGEEALRETARAVKEKCGEKVDVRCIPADLSDEESVAKMNRSIFGDIGNGSQFDAAIIIHNACSLVDVVKKNARDLSDVEFIQKYNLLNISGPIVMTSEFLRVFGKPGSGIRKTVIQLTSFGSTTPIKTGHLYCMNKAARDMFFKVMALEEPEVRILAYDPGVVETQMLSEFTGTADKDVLVSVESLIQQVLKPSQVVRGLIKILEEDKYESGAVVKYCDVMGSK